jgi:predicted nucleic-acid-binding protein
MGRQTVKMTADTNVLVRALLEDHPQQSKAAQAVLSKAELIGLSLVTLCELVWVLRSYKIQLSDIAATIRRLIDATNVAVNRPAAEAGLAMLDAGGDFADGVIAYEGNWLGANSFVSFDKRACNLLESQGRSARLLS